MNMMPPPNFGDTSERKQVTFYDGTQPILTVISSSEYIVHNQDGSESEVKDYSFIATVDGQMIHTSSLFGQNCVHIGACRLCRRPPWSLFGRKDPTHGLVLISRQRGGAKKCRCCGSTLCRRHQHWVNGRPYCCSPCARSAKFKRFLRKLFFTAVEKQ